MTEQELNKLRELGVTPSSLQKPAQILYMNWLGDMRWRRVMPLRIWYGVTKWHPNPGLLLHCLDLEKGETRDFSIAAIREWRDEE
jgi:hypothetical protein